MSCAACAACSARARRALFFRQSDSARALYVATVSSVSLKKNRPQRANLRFSPSPRVLFLLASGTRGLFACFDTKLNSELGAFSHENVQRRLDVERDFRRFFPSHTPSFFPFFVFVKSPRVFSSHTPSSLSIFAGVTRVLRASAFVAYVRLGIAAARLILPDARTRASPVRSRSRTFRVRVALEPHSCA